MNKKIIVVAIAIVALLAMLLPIPVFANTNSVVVDENAPSYSANTTVNTDIGGTVPEYEYTMTISLLLNLGCLIIW